jgi:hypothetical protein
MYVCLYVRVCVCVCACAHYNRATNHIKPGGAIPIGSVAHSHHPTSVCVCTCLCVATLFLVLLDYLCVRALDDVFLFVVPCIFLHFMFFGLLLTLCSLRLNAFERWCRDAWLSTSTTKTPLVLHRSTSFHHHHHHHHHQHHHLFFLVLLMLVD